jgi:hypothetical protein
VVDEVVMNDDLSPGYLSSLVPNILRNIHDHNTRHSTLIPPVRARTTLYANYVLPQTVRSWIITLKIRVITKLPNSEQSYKGKVKTHNYINRQNQSTTGKL